MHWPKLARLLDCYLVIDCLFPSDDGLSIHLEEMQEFKTSFRSFGKKLFVREKYLVTSTVRFKGFVHVSS